MQLNMLGTCAGGEAWVTVHFTSWVEMSIAPRDIACPVCGQEFPLHHSTGVLWTYAPPDFRAESSYWVPRHA